MLLRKLLASLRQAEFSQSRILSPIAGAATQLVAAVADAALLYVATHVRQLHMRAGPAREHAAHESSMSGMQVDSAGENCPIHTPFGAP